MKIRILFISLVSILFCSCSTTYYTVTGNYHLKNTSSNLKEVKIKQNNQIYSDEFVTIQPNLGLNKVVSLTITNHHNSTIRILWDEAAFVDTNGSSHRIMHTGTNYDDKEKEQIPHVIPSGAYITTAVTSIDNKFESFSYTYKNEAQRTANYFNTHPQLHTARLLFPLEIDGNKVEYMMNFEGAHATIEGLEDSSNSISEGGLAVVLISALASLGLMLTTGL